MNDVTAFLTELGLSERIRDDVQRAAQSRQFIPELNRNPDEAFYEFFYANPIPQMGVTWSEYQDWQNWDFKHQLLPLMKAWAETRWPAGPGTVIDLGCGSGLDLCYLARAFTLKQFIGIDSSAPARVQVEGRVRKLGLSNVGLSIADAFGDSFRLDGGPASSLRPAQDPEPAEGLRAGCDAVILNNIMDSSFPSARALGSKLRKVRQLLRPAGTIWLSLTPVLATEAEMEQCVTAACRRTHLSIVDHGRFDYAQGTRQVRHLWWSLGCLALPPRPWWQFWR